MKEKRNKTGNVPNLRFKGFEGEWEVKKLGDTGTFFSGGTPLTSKRHYFNGDIPFIRSGELNAKYTEQFISEEGLSNSSAKMIEVGDLIFALYGATSGEVGISKIKGAINQAILCMRTSLNNVFLLNYLRLQKETILNTYLQGGQGNLSAEIIKSITVPIPPQKEQDYIASFLSLIDERITAQSKIIQRLETLMQGLREKLFTQKLKFKDSNGSPFPDWEVKKLGKVFSFKTTNSYSREKMNHERGEVKNIHYGDIHTKYQTLFDIDKVNTPYMNVEVNIKNIAKENYCREGDVIFADASEDLEDVGKSIEIVNLGNQNVLAGLHTLLARPEGNIFSIGFCGYLFKSKIVRTQIQKEAQGSKVLSISVSRLSNISLSLPCIAEQTKIACFLSALDNKIGIEIYLLQQLKNQKRYLLQNLFI